MTETALQKTDAVIQGLGSLSIFRQIGMMIGLSGCVAVGVWIALWSKEPSFRPLYTDISHIEANQVADILQTEGILFEIDTNSGMLLVEADKIHEARLKLAASGMSSENGVGYELLDQKQAFGTSQFLEKARYHRSLEGELSKTISSISSVRSARVHLAIPKKTVFVGDQRKSSASVFVDLYPGRILEKGQVASVVHLVSSSIPQMSSKDVTVVDQMGTLLSDNNEDEEIKLASRNLEYSRNIEKRYLQRISNILEPILGEKRFKVEVTADIDFTRIEQTSEVYNPDLPALRSEQVLDEKMASGQGAGGIPGALSNQPPDKVTVPEKVVAQANQQAVASENNQNVRSQAARNYELDRTISHTRHQLGRIKRISVAVVIDNKIVSIKPGSVQDSAPQGSDDAADQSQGKSRVESVPLSADEVSKITALVRDAIGYDVQRGDSVNVFNQAFIGQSNESLWEPQSSEWWKELWFRELTKQIFVIVFVLAMLLGILKPVMNSLVKSTDTSDYDDSDINIDLEALSSDEYSEDEAQLAIESGPESLLPGPEQSYDSQVTAIKNLVANDSRLVAQVVKQWIAKE